QCGSARQYTGTSTRTSGPVSANLYRPPDQMRAYRARQRLWIQGWRIGSEANHKALAKPDSSRYGLCGMQRTRWRRGCDSSGVTTTHRKTRCTLIGDGRVGKDKSRRLCRRLLYVFIFYGTCYFFICRFIGFAHTELVSSPG